MAENHLLVSQGFRHLLNAFAPYIARELQIEFGPQWWKLAVLDRLYEDQKRNLPETGSWGQLVDSLDIQRCLILFDIHWNEVFRKKLSVDHRTWAKELMGVRNKLAHIGGNDFSDDDTWRALDTMSRLCEQIDAQSTEEIRSILREFRYGSANGSTAVLEANGTPKSKKSKSSGILEDTPVKGLPSWREVIEPHPDVAQGRYLKAEFAADLAQVARGEAALEYQDPVEFFARTYITEGMTGLLVQALRRVSGKDGEPVIQLKTAFGGGKTHSMLALYHLLRGRAPLEKIPSVKPILAAAGLTSLPRVNVAVLVGTALDPTKVRRPNNFPGITIHTLWGEMAAQLAISAEKPDLYDYVKEADKKGVSPGSETLKNLFDACGPCLILIDELVAYGRKIYGATDLPAGTFDNLVTFVQELTEAARASKNSLVVASIPESNIEIGGEAGKIVLETIEHTFGRMESIWKPVAASEGFEVVRRRLFLDCKDPESRDRVCDAFSRMYLENEADFPVEARELEYKQRLAACYPIHPEVFDRLYEDWATLERFQRTRGVLRLMAAVIHELWMANDQSLLILPGSIPLDVPSVREELTRHLPEGWNALIDREIDGKKSIPYQKDQANPRFGKKLAARRVARAIMLGSAPTVRAQHVRGIEASRIRLGVVQPGENIADFNDALSTLQNSLSYLYVNLANNRYWYDTRPTLRKLMEDRAKLLSEADVEYEIEQRLRRLRREEPFSGVHPCPGSSLDVPDEQSVRLVILRPDDTFRANTPERSRAIQAAEDILNNRGSSPRIYRNMLAFIAPDGDLITSLRQEVRHFLAWQSIKKDSEALNLDAAQNRETESHLKRSDETVTLRIQEAYCWLLVPNIDRNVDIRTISWERIRISGGDDNIVAKAARKLIQNEWLITRWAPALLLMELDQLLWKEDDHIQIKKLWEQLCTYCYLPRLANFGVLEETIRQGINSTEYFALAAGITENRYLDLKFNQEVSHIDGSSYLVKLVPALRQLAEMRVQPSGGVVPTAYPETAASGSSVHEPPPAPGTDNAVPMPVSSQPQEPKHTRFYLSARLDTTRINRDVQRLVEEVISHLIHLDGCKVNISLELDASAPDGIPHDLVRVLSENSRTLKVDNFGFEESG